MGKGTTEAVPTVNGIRYKPKGCATEAFSYAFDLPVYADRPDDDETGAWVRTRLAQFVQAMPDWVAWDTVKACEALAALVREAHPACTPPLPAVAGDVELWGFCDDPDCPKEHIHEEGDCRRCRLPDDHPAVVRMRRDMAAAAVEHEPGEYQP